MADDPCVYPQAASQLDSLGMDVNRPTPSPKGLNPMSIAEQHYAFFAYSVELGTKCIKHLENQYIGTGIAVVDPDTIRIYLKDMRYCFAKTMRYASQRDKLPDWVFDSLMLMPDEQTRIAFITDLYAEQYEQLEKAMDSKSSRPWAK